MAGSLDGRKKRCSLYIDPNVFFCSDMPYYCTYDMIYCNSFMPLFFALRCMRIGSGFMRGNVIEFVSASVTLF